MLLFGEIAFQAEEMAKAGSGNFPGIPDASKEAIVVGASVQCKQLEIKLER